MRQMVDVAAEDGQLAGGGVERGKARGALDRRDDRRRGVDQAHQVGPPGQPGGAAVQVEAMGDEQGHADG